MATELAHAWPATNVELVPVDKLVPYARNARTHSPTQVAQIAASIMEWGWTVPVLVDEHGTIIAGHGRVLAAQKLGLYRIPVMTARGWSAAQKKAYVIADNKLAENAGWDAALFKIEFEDLRAAGFSTDLIGFDKDPIHDDRWSDSNGSNHDGADKHGLLFSIAGRKVEITEAERVSFQALLDRYAEEFGVHYGFAAWLCEAVEAGCG